ncbi:Toxin YoeB [Neolewinella maritima]|uniref:Putative mRNA interferase YoeB n=1 Tax=Neolewinella maritima TaxID=1383882 RepID=A0ABM9AW19_9BACT|nr:Txe/YoeB family addiction module toxin [Neolewinella maritima]CAH0998869.1 Toxin YoeB [Neolewinella maritima]
MEISFSTRGFDDLLQLLEREPKLARKLARLLREIRKHPFTGTGKPEPLKHEFSGWWSRRINQEHRLVYRITTREDGDQVCEIVQCFTHYG